MPNHNYRKGADYERKIVKQAREQGYIAFRSAGSHSPIDVCIIDVKNQKIRFIQCKAGKSYSAAQKKKLKDLLSFIDGEYVVSCEVLP